MNIVITGAAGFLGERLTDALLRQDSPLPVARLLLVDRVAPRARADSRVATLALDLGTPGVAHRALAPRPDLLLHLAAIVSGHAEDDFDLGLRVNFDATRELLEAARLLAPGLRFVYASSIAVFGGDPPPKVDDATAATPQSSYGAAKAMSELLLNEYGRRGFVDARAVRLPTVTVRGGSANRAASSFASALVREPMRGEAAAVPVRPEQALWVCSPRTAVRNVLHAAALPPGALGAWRAVTLPGLCVTAREMVQALSTAAGAAVAALVRYEVDEAAARIVRSLPAQVSAERALRLGFFVDEDFTEIIHAYIRDDLNCDPLEDLQS